MAQSYNPTDFLDAAELPATEKGQGLYKQLSSLKNGTTLRVTLDGLTAESYTGRKDKNGVAVQRERIILRDAEGVAYLCPGKLAERVAENLKYADAQGKRGVAYKIDHDAKGRLTLKGGASR